MPDQVRWHRRLAYERPTAGRMLWPLWLVLSLSAVSCSIGDADQGEIPGESAAGAGITGAVSAGGTDTGATTGGVERADDVAIAGAATTVTTVVIIIMRRFLNPVFGLF